MPNNTLILPSSHSSPCLLTNPLRRYLHSCSSAHYRSSCLGDNAMKYISRCKCRESAWTAVRIETLRLCGCQASDLSPLLMCTFLLRSRTHCTSKATHLPLHLFQHASSTVPSSITLPSVLFCRGLCCFVEVCVVL